MSRTIKKSKTEKLYSVSVPLFASTIIKVRANSQEEALKKAQEEAGAPMLCHQCSDDCEIHDVDTSSMTLNNVSEIEDDEEES